MHHITATVEKENGEGLSFEDATLVELGGQIAHTVSTKEPHFSVNHCNMAIEFRELKTMNYTQVRFAIDEQNMLVRSETIGTLTTDGNSPKHNNRIAECKQIKVRSATEQGFDYCEIGGAADLNYPTSQTRRGRVIENGRICPTLTTEYIPNVIELGNPDFFNFVYKIEDEWWLIRIRKLTPKECWRLMGFYDEDFEKAEKVNSNTQLYKQAGNSIVVNVLEEIFKQMI